jgi:acetolactate synthase-1/2/3 large subunit
MSTSRRELARSVVLACREAGTTHLFGVPGGGSNLDVVGEAHIAGIEFVLVHTETAAAVMAGVMGELTGAPGMCVATRGPGAASAVNGMAQALLDRQPVVLVTDSVAASDRARVSHQRLAQQALMTPVSKASVVLDGREADAALHLVATALAMPPGPVQVDLDPTVEAAATAAGSASLPPASEPIIDLAALVRRSRRPVLVVGVGAIVGGAAQRARVADAVRRFATAGNVPVLCTYKARGMVADTAPTCAGVATGATIESPVLHAADLIIGVGLDPVELIPAAWPYAAPLVLVGRWTIDDSTFFGDHLTTEYVTDIAVALDGAIDALATDWAAADGQAYRRQALAELAAQVPAAPVGLVPQQVVAIARSVAPADTVATVDAGAHMLVAMPLWEVDAPAHLLISSGLATMGFALPASVAAALAYPGRRVVCFTGDGGIGMALAELETLARLQLPVLVVVFDDALLSLIAAKQQPSGHGGEAAVRYAPVDFAAVAAGCGVAAERVDDHAAYEQALRRAFQRNGPTLIDVVVDPSAYAAVLDAIRGPREAPSA